MKRVKSIEIPEDVYKALRLPKDDIEREVLKELGVSLYSRGILSLGKARKLTGLTKWEFSDELKERKIKRHYGKEELEEDIEYARKASGNK